ncbi:hypothetical protein MO867_22710, partial [Microbulbifer sp. OS29]|nr:hypothetical protein [Microbulbifer okhotskensis]
YADHAVKVATAIRALGIKCLAADAYFSKVKFVSAIILAGFHIVEKLQIDTNLQWLYEGAYKGTGRPRKYNGRVDFDTDMHRFDCVGFLNEKT